MTHSVFTRLRLRVLSLALAALMLLGLSAAALTGCDKEEKQTETVTETETEAETEVPLAEAEPEVALTRVMDNLGSRAENAAADVSKKAADGTFDFSFGVNLKAEVQVVLTTKMTLLGTTTTSETTASVVVTVADGGVSVTVSVPEMLEVAVVCADKTVYISTTMFGVTSKQSFTFDTDMQKELADLLNGKASDVEGKALDTLRSALKDTGVADVFGSVASAADGEKLTISCTGIKSEFVAKLKQLAEDLKALAPDETETETDGADTDESVSEESGLLDTLLSTLASVVPDDFSLELDVDMDGQVLAVRAQASILQSKTEDYGDVKNETTIAASVTLTRGGQTVEKPADAEEYETSDDLPQIDGEDGNAA